MTGPRSDVSAMYGAEPTTRWLGGAFLLLASVFFAMIGFTLVRVLLSAPKPVPSIVILPVVLILGCACLFGVLGVMSCLGAARGLPRLTVTPAGVRLSTIFGVKWAEWSSLSAFVLSTVPAPRGAALPAAKARLVGSNVSQNLRRKSEFVIVDMFRTPIAAVVGDLNRLRPSTPGNAAALRRTPPLGDPRALRMGSLGTTVKILVLVASAVSLVVAGYQVLAVGLR